MSAAGGKPAHGKWQDLLLFSRLNNIPLCGLAASSVSIHESRDTWVVSVSWVDLLYNMVPIV